MRLPTLSVVAILLSASGNAQGEGPWPLPVDPEAAAAVAGCYLIDADPWPDSLAHLPSPDRLPEWIALSDEPVELFPPWPRGATGLAVGYPPGTERFPLRFWLVSERGVLIGSSAPVSNRVTVYPTGTGDLEGRVSGHDDILFDDKPSTGSVPVRLARFPCPAP